MPNLNDAAPQGVRHALDDVRQLVRVNLAPHVETILRRVLGAPNESESTHDQWRYGTHGSLAVELTGERRGHWFSHETGHGGESPWSLMTNHAGYTPEDAAAVLAELGIKDPTPKRERKIVATYDYHDATGALVFQVVRMEPKTFRQRRPPRPSDAPDKIKNGWVWSVKGIQLVPYRLPELIAAPLDRPVYIVEGEKDTDNGRVKLGIIATTNPGGTGKWHASYAQYFRGRHVVIVQDNDPQARNDGTRDLLWHPDGRPRHAGQDHAQDVAANLHAHAASVRVLALPNLPEKGDLTDWIGGGGAREELDAFARAVPVWSPAPAPVCEQPAHTPETAPVVATPSPNVKPIPAWVAQVACYDNGEPRPILNNAAIALEQDAAWSSVLWFDEFSQRVIARRPPPWIKPNGHWNPAPWTDGDDLEATRWLQDAGIHLATTIAHDAAVNVAMRHRFHPVRDFLDSLKWDGRSRIDTWLSFHMGAEDSPYTRAIGARWLISAVARVRVPGSKVDTALIMVGPQGQQKSSALRILGGSWFTDELSEFGSKDASMQVSGVWIIELAELAAIRRGSEIERVKSFVSRAVDRYRAPYGRSVIDIPRQSVFAGSTNNDECLRDPTGARRWWPFNVGAIDLDSLKRDRDQLWAEAVYRYESGERWWLHEPELIEAARGRAADHQEVDPWEPIIAEWLIVKTTPGVMVHDVLTDVVKVPRHELNRSHQMRVADILIKMGYSRARVSRGGLRYWVYVPGTPSDTEPTPEPEPKPWSIPR